MMLENEVSVIYGAGGRIGGAVARAFATEGVKVFLTGLHGAAFEAVTKASLPPWVRRGGGSRRSRRAGYRQAFTVRNR
jgi:NAD(P)-dependent dehydrogenase (short-subunit alcohol dehydrogenase family)